MKCPTCPDATLVMTDRQGVEIDYCPACRGIWLDRGELEKLLDLTASVAVPATAAPTPTPRGRSHPDYRAAIADILENYAPHTVNRTLASRTASATRAAARSRG